jgi:hypothetical protein
MIGSPSVGEPPVDGMFSDVMTGIPMRSPPFIVRPGNSF